MFRKSKLGGAVLVAALTALSTLAASPASAWDRGYSQSDAGAYGYGYQGRDSYCHRRPTSPPPAKAETRAPGPKGKVAAVAPNAAAAPADPKGRTAAPGPSRVGAPPAAAGPKVEAAASRPNADAASAGAPAPKGDEAPPPPTQKVDAGPQKLVWP